MTAITKEQFLGIQAKKQSLLTALLEVQAEEQQVRQIIAEALTRLANLGADSKARPRHRWALGSQLSSETIAGISSMQNSAKRALTLILKRFTCSKTARLSKQTSISFLKKQGGILMVIPIPRKNTGKKNETECLTVDVATAAKMIGISSRLLWEKTDSGEVPCIRIGRKVRYSKQKLQQYVNGELESVAKNEITIEIPGHNNNGDEPFNI